MATSLALERQSQPWFRRLYQPTYQVSEAARYVDAPHQTVTAWRSGSSPVLTGHKKGRPLTYPELLEVAFVAFFRREGVKMRRIRSARDYIAQNFVAEHPLAEYEFKTEGMHVLMEYNQFDPDPTFNQFVVADQYGQLAWTQFSPSSNMSMNSCFDGTQPVESPRWYLIRGSLLERQS